jgi:AraC-like DNA-binding protein
MMPRFEFRFPPARLRRHVLGYHQAVTPPGQDVSFSAAPRGRAAIVFTLAGRYEATVGTEAPTAIPHAIVHGQFTARASNRFSAGHVGFLVLLQPTGAHALLGGPTAELTDRFAEIATVAHRPPAVLRDLADRLRELPGFAARCALVDQVLTGLLARHRHPPATLGLAEAAAGMIDHHGGRLGMGDLADRLGVPQRTLRRQFREAVGIPPKLYASIVRFQGVVAELHAGRPVDWLDLVHRHGYADQSHLGREFRRFAGCTPGAYLPAGQVLDGELRRFG